MDEVNSSKIRMIVAVGRAAHARKMNKISKSNFALNKWDSRVENSTLENLEEAPDWWLKGS